MECLGFLGNNKSPQQRDRTHKGKIRIKRTIRGKIKKLKKKAI